MKNAIVLLLVAAIAMSGCISNNSKPNISYPSDIKGICEQARKDAESCIESKGKKASVNADIKLEKKPGEKRINGFWSWREPSWNGMWVTGLTWDKGGYYLIQVGCNPKNMQEIDATTVKHEHGHYFLMSNFKDYTHNPLYRSCFDGWSDTGRQAKLMTVKGEKVIVDFIEDADVKTIE